MRVQEPVAVEVFPLAPDRWVAVIDVAAGSFSTEAATADGVVGEVERALREVLREPTPAYRLAALDGRDWTDDVAREQAAGLSA